VNEDRRKEPPNPREPIELSDDDLHEKRVADTGNQSQQHALSPALRSAQVQQLYFTCTLYELYQYSI